MNHIPIDTHARIPATVPAVFSNKLQIILELVGLPKLPIEATGCALALNINGVRFRRCTVDEAISERGTGFSHTPTCWCVTCGGGVVR